LKDFFEDKTYPKLKLLEKLGYALGIVGNNDFFFQGDISHLGYKIKKGGRGGRACDKNKAFFLGKDVPLLSHYEQLLFEVTIFRQYVVACCQTMA
jgi:hypothetical protein